MEAYWAHNPEVRGSNPGRAMFFRMDLQKIDAFPDHLLSIKEKLSSSAKGKPFSTKGKEMKSLVRKGSPLVRTACSQFNVLTVNSYFNLSLVVIFNKA